MVSNQYLIGAGGMVGVFELGRWDITEVAVQAGVVVPVHPLQGGQLDGSTDRQGPCSGPWMSSALYSPLTVSAGALSNESPTDPIEGVAPSSARRSP